MGTETRSQGRSARFSAASSNGCACYQFTEGSVLSIAIAPGDVATDYGVLLFV